MALSFYYHITLSLSHFVTLSLFTCMRDRIIKFIFYIGLAIIGLLTVIKLPHDHGAAMYAGSKGYVGHALAYGILTLVGWRAFSSSRAALIGIVLVFGMCMEVLQLAIPHRTFNLLDFVSDGVGVFIACGMALICNRVTNADGGTVNVGTLKR